MGLPALDQFHEWTPEVRRAKALDLATILLDRRWRLDNLYNIVNKDGVAVRFSMFPIQNVLLSDLWYLNIILKSRQHGITTAICIYFLDEVMWRKEALNAAIIAHNKEDAQDIFRRNIKYAYDQLPPAVKAWNPAIRDATNMLAFKRGGSIRVTTSGRSGTFQRLHVSELGKIAAKYPEKANEIKTGSLNAVHVGQQVIIESTAEGKEGLFYELCEMAQKAAERGAQLSKMDYKFWFFPWFQNPANVLEDDVGTVIYDYQADYFRELRHKCAIILRPPQIAWYVKKWNVQGDDMKREHPSTPEEAFLVSIMGAYYSDELKLARTEGRITKVPHQKGILVDTWWDLGLSEENSTAIWFTQNVGREIHVIDYFEDTDRSFDWLLENVFQEWTRKKGYIFGTWGAPHDIRRREQFARAKSRLQLARDLGVNFKVAKRVSKADGIALVGKIMSICWFDEALTTKVFQKTNVGLPSLESYRREWDPHNGTYKQHPLHNWASHGADAFKTMATLHEFKTAAQAWAEQRRRDGGPAGPTNIDKKNPGGWT
jgi:hypothetical protein